MRKTFIAIAAASAIFAAPAAAQDAAEDVTIAVQTDDLDLTDTADQDRLDARVETAIRQACRSGGRDLTSRRVEAACRNALADSIAPRVELAIIDANAPRLAALDLEPGA
ncbi:UrcA family protein [Aurantiacibacter aquimixticola]|uniref:UrcA family protein n=1 Tax=Aurantiacibacter aquimixticola TaxID=1958945 RepID=A0A419RRW4_9SPHN|nr:UrcA family protein [Aurantiacibacter aquimixticola]RJY08509.1 UrcA family protein [Aurantiacibacter aquimixticola]